jgi:hypothetical protein
MRQAGWILFDKWCEERLEYRLAENDETRAAPSRRPRNGKR